MKRELKVDQVLAGLYTDASFKTDPDEKGTERDQIVAGSTRLRVVSRLIPMKRELKARSSTSAAFSRSMCFKTDPDEKGTESRSIGTRTIRSPRFKTDPDEKGTERALLRM